MARDRRRTADREQDQAGDLHTRIFELLLDKVRGDQYPSTSHLDMLQGMLRDQDDVEAFTSVLMERIGQETYPSMDHLRRLKAYA
jgi:hypothetical protein